MAAAKRKAISKKVRFEVFKRDSFTCQYCGAAAPDVILHVDHIDPVSKGGDNNILNLITSCADCNGGKSATKLDDHSALLKQRKQLVEINERVEQLKMMAGWRRAVMQMADQELDLLIDETEHALGDLSVNDSGRVILKRLLKKHGLDTAIKAVHQSIERYAEWRDGCVTNATMHHVFSGFEKVAAYVKLPQETQDAHYCRGILRNRFPDEVYPGSCEWAGTLDLLVLALRYYSGREMKDVAKAAATFDDWVEDMQVTIGIAESGDA